MSSRHGRSPLFSAGCITFYSALVSIRYQGRLARVEWLVEPEARAGEPAGKVQDLSAERPGRKAGSDGALPLRPAFLHRAELGLFCHTSKLAEERKRSSAAACGLFLECDTLQAVLAFDFDFAKSASISRLNAGISEGWRLDTQLASLTTSSSCQLPPALRMSSWMVW